MSRQRTIAEKVSCTGIGLHSGLPLQLTLYPARAHTGVVFVRRDHQAADPIAARSSAVVSTSHATTLASEHDRSLRVMTVEHVLAALAALRIDNVRLELDGPEVPAMDGSAMPFVRLLRAAGVFVQRERRATLRVLKALEVVDGERKIRISPSRAFKISYVVDFAHPVIGRQELTLNELNAERFEREIAPARTFGFLREVSALLKQGLARGGSLENTVVLDDDGVLNTGGLIWPDEFVRHKMLDLIGDLALLGMPIQGHVEVERGGHELHHRLVLALLSSRDAWCIAGEGAALPGMPVVPA